MRADSALAGEGGLLLFSLLVGFAWSVQRAPLAADEIEAACLAAPATPLSITSGSVTIKAQSCQFKVDEDGTTTLIYTNSAGYTFYSALNEWKLVVISRKNDTTHVQLIE